MSNIIKKGIVSIVLIVLTSVVFNAFEPTISGQVAVGQLQDTVSSSASMDLYRNFRDYFWITYLVIPFLVFFTDIIKLIKK